MFLDAMPTFDDFSFVVTRLSVKERTLEHRLRHDLCLLVPVYAIEATAADRHWVRSVYPTPPTALAEVEGPLCLHVEVSPMPHYFGLWMRTVNADHLTWRIHSTLWAQAAAGMILSEASSASNRRNCTCFRRGWSQAYGWWA